MGLTYEMLGCYGSQKNLGVVIHPFFRLMDELMGIIMHKICRKALEQQQYGVDEIVFCSGDEAKNMFFPKQGDLQYRKSDGNLLEPTVDTSDWVSEPVLWTIWRHQGHLKFVHEGELIVVRPSEFHEV